MASSSFEAAVKDARRYEMAVGAWLRERGWYVLPAYDYTGSDGEKAPKLIAAAQETSLIVPDLLVAKEGTSKWCEVKFKTCASVTTCRGGQLETGIPLRHWVHYGEVQSVSGIEVWLFFAHLKENEVRCRSLDDLAALPPRIYAGHKMSRGGMAFFPWEFLKFAAILSDIIQPQTAKESP